MEVKDKDVTLKARPEFKTLRRVVTGLNKKDYRALQAGEEVSVKKSIYDAYSQYFEIVTRKVKNGN